MENPEKYMPTVGEENSNNTQEYTELTKTINQLLENLSWEATVALGETGLARAVDELIRNLGDEDSTKRSRAIDTLENIGLIQVIDGLIKLLEDEYIPSSLGDMVVKSIKKIGLKKAAKGLTKALENGDDTLRSHATGMLYLINAQIDRLIEIIKYSDGLEAEVASKIVVKIGTDYALEKLIEVLEDEQEDYRSRCYVAFALGSVNSEQVVKSLSKVLETHLEEQDLCDTVAYALAEIDSDRAIESLLKATICENYKARRAANEVLPSVNDEELMDRLIEVLENQDFNVFFDHDDSLMRRMKANIFSLWAIEVLSEALQYKDVEVRQIVADNLRNSEIRRLI